jgi:hypothetical protein
MENKIANITTVLPEPQLDKTFECGCRFLLQHCPVLMQKIHQRDLFHPWDQCGLKLVIFILEFYT